MRVAESENTVTRLLTIITALIPVGMVIVLIIISVDSLLMPVRQRILANELQPEIEYYQILWEAREPDHYRMRVYSWHKHFYDCMDMEIEVMEGQIVQVLDLDPEPLPDDIRDSCRFEAGNALPSVLFDEAQMWLTSEPTNGAMIETIEFDSTYGYIHSLSLSNRILRSYEVREFEVIK